MSYNDGKVTVEETHADTDELENARATDEDERELSLKPSITLDLPYVVR